MSIFNEAKLGRMNQQETQRLSCQSLVIFIFQFILRAFVLKEDFSFLSNRVLHGLSDPQGHSRTSNTTAWTNQTDAYRDAYITIKGLHTSSCFRLNQVCHKLQQLDKRQQTCAPPTKTISNTGESKNMTVPLGKTGYLFRKLGDARMPYTIQSQNPPAKQVAANKKPMTLEQMNKKDTAIECFYRLRLSQKNS